MRRLKWAWLVCSLFFCAMACGATFKTLDGETFSTGDLSHRWLIINYWAGWCDPCLQEISVLNRFYQSHSAEKVLLLSVNYDHLPTPALQRLVKKLHIHYPVLTRDPARELKLGFISAIPVTFIFNPQGKLVDTSYGGVSLKYLNRMVSG